MAEKSNVEHIDRNVKVDRGNVQYGRKRANFRSWDDNDEMRGEMEVANWDAGREANLRMLFDL